MPNLLKDNYELALKYNADLIRFSRAMVVINDGKVTKEEHPHPFDFEVLEGDAVHSAFRKIRNASLSLWAGMYRREIIEKHHFTFDESFDSYEDVLFNSQFYGYVNCLF